MFHPNEYRHIAAWGRLLGSYPYYIEQQQVKAAMEQAPIKAIYYNIDKAYWETSNSLPQDHDVFNYL